MQIPVRVEPSGENPAEVRYRWDVDTDILSAAVEDDGAGGTDASTSAVEVAGRDGSWLILGVREGQLEGVEVAVWPTVRRRSDLSPPSDVQEARVFFAGGAPGRVAPLACDTLVDAEADRSERTIHFRLGTRRETRTVRVARDILIDVDQRDRMAGVWLLGVPPHPATP